MKLFPKDDSFFEHFRRQAVLIGRATALLRTLFETPADAPRIAADIKAVESEGDGIVHLINQRIDTSFVTPLDREDIHLLAKRLDNVIDLVNGAARRVVMFRVTVARPGGVEMAEVLVQASALILKATGDVTRRGKMLEHGRAMKALEEEGDTIYARSVGALFEERIDAVEVLKWKEIYDALENAIDECEDVTNVLESIALKNS